MPALVDRLLEHLQSEALFPGPGLALVAVSGGADSVALLDLLVQLRSPLKLELAVSHVDHGIAGDSAAVARQVEELARGYGLETHVARLGLGPRASETAARRGRYRALRRMQRDADARYLVTAHHADDQGETVLYRLLRGTGLAGLAGIPARGPRGLVRPLLPFRRRELEAWVAARRAAGVPLPVHRDPANADERHDRAWLRHRLLPVLEDRFGDLAQRRLAQVARHAGGERQAWASVLRELSELDFRVRGEGVEVARAPLLRYDKVLSQALLRALAREVGCVVGPRRAARVLASVKQSSSGRVLELGSGWEAELAFDRLRIVRSAAPGEPPEPAEWAAEPQGSVTWSGWQLRWRQEPAGTTARRSFTTWLTPGPGTVRGPRAGDRIAPLGGVGRRRVRRLLMEARVPFRERGRYPVLTRGGEVLWIPGVCRSGAAVPQPGEPALRIDAQATEY